MVSPTIPETAPSEQTRVVPPVGPRRAGTARWKPVAYSVAGAISFLVVWQIVSGYTRTEFDLLPGPVEVAERMGDYIFGDEAENIPTGWVFVNFWDTFRKTLYGFFGALVIGVPIGILMGRYRYAKNFFFDFIYLAANVPLIVYAILGLLIFGIGDAGPAFVVGLLVLPVIALNVAAGVEGVDRNLISMSRAYGLKTQTAMRHIVIPSLAPFLFAGSRASFAASWKLAALAETFGGTTGVGVQIRKAFQGFSVTDMLAWMMFFVIFVVVIERVVLMRLERWVFRYRLKRGEDILRY
ncbi:MAG TPA: ABC transporter permease [Acidimicrobiia bacterium]|jgi:NitT/TauT family transport system permease protein|nr:ABC transporter permease [Acidimicrobiia bacterium]